MPIRESVNYALLGFRPHNLVTKIKGVATEGERAEEVINHPGQVVEGVCEFLGWRRVGMTEAKQVGSDEMETVPKALEEQVIHPR